MHTEWLNFRHADGHVRSHSERVYFRGLMFADTFRPSALIRYSSWRKYGHDFVSAVKLCAHTHTHRLHWDGRYALLIVEAAAHRLLSAMHRIEVLNAINIYARIEVRCSNCAHTQTDGNWTDIRTKRDILKHISTHTHTHAHVCVCSAHLHALLMATSNALWHTSCPQWNQMGKSIQLANALDGNGWGHLRRRRTAGLFISNGRAQAELLNVRDFANSFRLRIWGRARLAHARPDWARSLINMCVCVSCVWILGE